VFGGTPNYDCIPTSIYCKRQSYLSPKAYTSSN
jgi:hypothetical protein